MTMRLDIVTNDAGELVRREHARDLGAGVVVAIYRLAKLAMMHDLTNQAFIRQLEQTHQMMTEYCLRSGAHINVLFAHKAVFVAGQLLKGSRGTYDAAAELGELFERLGGSELFIQREVTREEVHALAEQISICHRTGAQFRSPSPRVRLRAVSDAARLRGIALEDLPPDQRICRAYASAVIIMRRFYEDLQASKYILPRRIKRIAQTLVDLSDAQTSAFLGVTEVRNANYDEAGRAANTAILSVAIARELTGDRTTLSQIAMAAMMHDVARPRAMALAAAAGPAMPGMAGPSTLSEDQEDRLASGAAAVLTALGRVNEPSITRTVLTFEALWLRRKTWLGPVYWGARNPTLHASIIAIGRRYNDLLTPEPGLAPPTPDYAVAMLANELTDPQDRSVLRMLVSALGLLPVGTVVQLQTGEIAEVVKGAQGLGDKPVVRLLADPNNQPYAQQMDVDVAQDPRRAVLRVLGVDGWKKGLAQQPQSDIEAEYDPDANNSAPPPAPHTQPQLESVPPSAPAIAMPPPAASAHISPLQPVLSASNHVPPARAQYEQQYAQWGEEEAAGEAGDRRDSSSFESSDRASSQSMPSMGSSPSAVAEAMGRMINDSLRPPNVTPAGAERTVFQPGGPDELAGRSTKRPTVGREPTARGNLASTPLPHVLVYMLDHSLTGSVVFEGEGNDDTIFFVHGVPAKVRLSEPIALLGDVLIDAGALEKAAIEQPLDAAKRLNTLFGEYLVAHELVSREMLSWALESQLLQKIAHLANLAPEIEYLYYRDVDLLPSWGAETSVTHPLNPILGSVRNWQDRGRIRATLNRVSKHALVQHPDSDLNSLAMMPEEQVVLEAIHSEAMTLPQLFKRNFADEEIVSSLIYSLAVTRQFAFKGQKKGPMAARNAAWGRVSGPPAGSGSISPTSSSQSIPSHQQAVSVSGSRPVPAAHTASAVAQNAPGPISSPISTTGPQMPSPSPSPPVRRSAERPAAQVAAPAPSQRMPAAAASGVPRVNAPQIRPITAKKATVVGLQPAAPPEQRSPSGSMRQVAPPPAGINVPAPAKRGAGPSAPAPSGLARSGRPAAAGGADDEDNAKTIAFDPGSNPLKDLLAKKGQMPNAPIGRPGPAADPAVSKRPTVRKEASEEDISFDDAGSIDFGEDMEDAEAALEAMQNFRLAEAALQRNDVANAAQLAQKAVDGDPTQADYLTLLAWVKALGNDANVVKSAVATMSKVLIEDPSNERALLYRGKLLVRTNRLHDALNDFNELLATNPHHREASSELRALKQKMGTP